MENYKFESVFDAPIDRIYGALGSLSCKPQRICRDWEGKPLLLTKSDQPDQNPLLMFA
jgi:hypothetical protein